MNIDEINLYRIIHIENIPHVLRYGITHRNSITANPNFVPIGDPSLIETRSTKSVRVDNGNDENANIETIVLGDFIPFYFGVRMPMLYVVQNGGNFVKKATSPEDIIYIAYRLRSVLETGVTFFFSDGHATDRLTSFFDSGKVEDLPNLIDWKAVKSKYWGGQENLNIKRMKQAELLVADDLPPDGIRGFGCYNTNALRRLVQMGIHQRRIKVIPNAYY